MERSEFVELIKSEWREILALNEKKGRDYAGDEDVVSNFKRNAEALGVTPEIVWAVYAGKHWDAIQTFCREGDVASEPISGRLRDLIVYCLLLLAINVDKVEAATNEEAARHAKRYQSRIDTESEMVTE